jgi:hypothetical protein
MLRSVIVNLRSDRDTAIRGVLWQVRGPWFVLRTVDLLSSGTPTRMDGDVVIHRDNVAFLQVVPPPASE